MSSKTISLAGEVHISTGSIYTTVDALEAMKCIGVAYGIYSHAEVTRKTIRTLTDNPQRIQRYLAFRDTLKMIQGMDREQEHQPAPKQPPQKKGTKSYDR